MSSSLQVPDSLEEQDIGLYYHSRRSSPALSDTDISSSMSHPTSEPQLDTLGLEPAAAPHSTYGSLKSPSLSQVADGVAHQPILRSKTVPDLPSTASTEGDPTSFAFSAEKVQRMRGWVLAFVIGKPDVTASFRPRSDERFSF